MVLTSSSLFCPVLIQVISRVCMLMQVRTLEAGRIDLRWQIPALKDLQRNLREINMFIEVRILTHTHTYSCGKMF